MREGLIGGHFQSYQSLLSRHWSAQYLISSVKTNDRKDPDVSQGIICGHRDREYSTRVGGGDYRDRGSSGQKREGSCT